jgi:hypothetical protein
MRQSPTTSLSGSHPLKRPSIDCEWAYIVRGRYIPSVPRATIVGDMVASGQLEYSSWLSLANAIIQILFNNPTTSTFQTPESTAKRLRQYDHLSPQHSVPSNDSTPTAIEQSRHKSADAILNSPTIPCPEVGRDMLSRHTRSAYVRASILVLGKGDTEVVQIL